MNTCISRLLQPAHPRSLTLHTYVSLPYVSIHVSNKHIRTQIPEFPVTNVTGNTELPNPHTQLKNNPENKKDVYFWLLASCQFLFDGMHPLDLIIAGIIKEKYPQLEKKLVGVPICRFTAVST